ncbi:MAG: DUF386 domain-containing protein [Clostridiales bacterium]|nr:DUF386 domain-containing protein [Clostridiales bacterium]
MIIGHLDHLDIYRGLNSHMSKAIDYIKTQHWRTLPEGRHELGAESFYVSVGRYQTRTADPLSYEVHQRYLDIQIVLSGEEGMAYVEHDKLINLIPYDPARDISIWSSPKGTPMIVPLFEGRIAVLFPQDAHAPGLTLGSEPSWMHKVVIKVLWEV